MSYKVKSYWFALLFSLLFALITPNVQAQDAPTKSQLDFRFMHLSVEDGLAHNSVTAVIQDSTGFMWFGTADGLSRYDGYSFTNFKHDPSNKQSLSGNEVNDLLLADDGRLWVATKTGGVSIFDPLTETFSQFRPEERPNLDRANVTSLFQDETDHIWLGMADGQVGEFDPTNEMYRSYQLSRELDPRFVWDITREGTGTVWFAASTVFSMDVETAVIALTASSLEGERQVLLSAGCDDYLRKPFRESEIFDMMSKHLGVRYVYEEPTVEMNGRTPETALTTADLGSVSPSLLSELAEAIERIDLAQMDEVIDQIREEEPETAVKLQHLITQFDYDTILQAIEETKALST